MIENKPATKLNWPMVEKTAKIEQVNRDAFANTMFTISNFANANLEMIFETRKFLNVNFEISN